MRRQHGSTDKKGKDGAMLKRLVALFTIILGWQAEPAGVAIADVSILKSSRFCTNNGEDGLSEAPSGSAQFASLLNSYRNKPNWCVAGVDYAVGITPNVTVSGNTITETGAVNAPTNGDQKSFYPQSGGSLPSGIFQGTSFYICNVSGGSSTYSFTLSTASDCNSTVKLGALDTSFIALKLPQATTNTPSGATGWDGSSTCGYNGQAVTVCVTGSGVTLDHWDFSANGGWWILLGPVSNITMTNNYVLVGSNIWPVLQDLGNTPANVTFNNNQVDGNAVAVYATVSGTFSAGAAAITVASTSGVAVNMTAGDTTSPSALQGGTLVASIVGNTVNLSKPLAAVVTNGDTVGFARAPAPGTSLYGASQISFSDRGTTVVRYNWIRNTCSEHWQQSLPPTGGFANSAIKFNYNVFENTGWCAPINGAHGDVVQIYCGNPNNHPAANCSFQSITLNYNTVIQNNAKAQAGSSTFSLLFSGSYGGTAFTINVNNNTAVYPVANGVNTSTYGLAAINPSWISSQVNIQNNYLDPTSACAGVGKCGASYWSNIYKGNGGGTGPYTATCKATGNVNLVSGASLPKPTGKYC
jgi:hypothetical protein